MIFIDTGAFIARYLKADQYHFKAAGAWKTLSDDRTPLVTSSLVLTETINSDQAVSFTDCISFALMKSRRIYRAFSFDRHFDLPGFTRFPL